MAHGFRFEAEPFGYGYGAAAEREDPPPIQSDREYIKWVQASLNRILGLKLAVDGDMGAATRGAIRSFQKKQGLAVDGKVGKQTEAAIKAIRAAQAAPGVLAKPASGNASPAAAPSRPQASALTEQQQVSRWFLTGGQPAMPAVVPGNDVTLFVGGKDTFRAMVEAIRTATGFGDYICLLAYSLRINFPLLEDDKSTTVESLFKDASSKGVQVRAMLFHQFGTNNNLAEASFINRLPTGQAIYDDRMVSASKAADFAAAYADVAALPAKLTAVTTGHADLLKVVANLYPLHNAVGGHHQKVLIVKGHQGLIAFCGGVDIDPSRIVASMTDGSPYHDVHCRVRGAAAYELLRVFNERWMDHPDRSLVPSLSFFEKPPKAKAEGKTYVQVGRTYGNGRRHGGVPGGFRFAPNGEQSIRRMVLNAICQARRFIYLEDQYLTNLEISHALVKALPNIQHLTILIPDSRLLSESECPLQMHAVRRKFIDPLMTEGGRKVGVFTLRRPWDIGSYVHSKTWIFDDEFAITGSANCNRRGYTHDSEADVAIYDPRNKLVKDLRIALWARHLLMDPAALEDGVKSANFWWTQKLSVAPFNLKASVPVGDAKCLIASWDDIIDPDGS